MRGLAKTRSIKISLKKRAASERESVRLQPFVSSLAKNNSVRPEKQNINCRPISLRSHRAFSVTAMASSLRSRILFERDHEKKAKRVHTPMLRSVKTGRQNSVRWCILHVRYTPRENIQRSHGQNHRSGYLHAVPLHAHHSRCPPKLLSAGDSAASRPASVEVCRLREPLSVHQPWSTKKRPLHHHGGSNP